MKYLMLIGLFCLFFTFGLAAETVSEGWWIQTASTAGEGENIAMEISQKTPHIISLESNNGWVGYAWYVQEKGVYSGFFELLKDDSKYHKDDWTGEVFNIILYYDGLTMTMKAKSGERSFQATFWQK